MQHLSYATLRSPTGARTLRRTSPGSAMRLASVVKRRRLGKRNMPDDTLAYSVPGVYREMTDEEKADREARQKEEEEEAAEKAAKGTLTSRIIKKIKGNKSKKK